MLRLVSNNTPIDLAKGSSVELQRQSPLFFLSESSGEYSMPVTIAYSNNNVALIGDKYFDYPIKKQVRLAVDVYDETTYKYSCTLVINKSNINNRFKNKSTLEGFLVGGISVFALQVKNVLLKNLEFGGNRVITNCYVHLKNTWDFTYDYIAAPIQNEQWLSSDFDGFMNSLDSAGNFKTDQPIAVQPKLSYVLNSIFSEFGWRLDTTNLDGTDWEKLVLFNAASFTPQLTTLTLNLADCFDKDVFVIDFIIAICTRYGWTLIPNNAAKTVALVSLKTTAANTYKNVTAYANSELQSDYSGGLVVYGFKNTLPGSDAALSTPDFTNWQFANGVIYYANLPGGDLSGYDNKLVYVFNENKYYKTVFNTTSSLLEWVVFADNIYDYSPLLSTAIGLDVLPTEKNIETICSTLPVYKTLYRSNGGTNYYAYLPYCKQKSSDTWGIRTLLYLGLIDETLLDGTTPGPIDYPMLSSLCFDNFGVQKAQWSNVFKHIKPTDNVDYGIIEFWHTKWLTSTNVQATETTTLTVPLYDLPNINFETPVLINNLSYLLTQIVEPIPFLNKIQITLKRFLLPQEIKANQIGSNIFLRITFLDEETIPYNAALGAYSSGFVTAYKVKLLKIEAFANADATVIYNCVTLPVNVRRYTDNNPDIPGVPDFTTDLVVILTGSVKIIQYFAADLTLPDGSIVSTKTCSQIDNTSGGNIAFTYGLQPSASYTII